MRGLEEISNLQELISEWATFGQVDLSAWDANDVLSVIAMQPETREKFIAVLEQRLNGQLQ
ncbi:MAG: hypothetical protein RLZZ563_1698 [Pseudomonadota bacterium]|jgi:hypothetical protein